MMRMITGTCTALVAGMLMVGCSSTPKSPLPHEDKVDLQRFMGAWYVIANIPTFIEKDIYNAVESYELAPDGTIDTTFTFRKGGFDGDEKRYTPRGFVVDEVSNAVWGMRFVWPIKAEYVIAYVDDAYQHTIIGRSARDYVWIMARTPTLSDEVYADLVARVAALGYDTALLQKVPQRWP